jgi:hypothetical protein
MLTAEVLAVIPDVPQIFVDAPEDRPRSRLEPYRAQILLWRRQGKTYRRIRHILNDECGVKVAHATLFNFVQRRKRLRMPAETGLEAEHQAVPVISAKPQRSVEEIAAMRESARSVNQPVLEEKKLDPRPRFVYDPSKPPVNKNYY